MGEIIFQYVIPFLTLIFGGGFFWQLYTIRAYKRKSNSEADSAEIKNLSAIIGQMKQRLDHQQQEIERLTKQQTENFNTIATLQKQILNEGTKCLKCEYRKYFISHANTQNN